MSMESSPKEYGNLVLAPRGTGMEPAPQRIGDPLLAPDDNASQSSPSPLQSTWLNIIEDYIPAVSPTNTGKTKTRRANPSSDDEVWVLMGDRNMDLRASLLQMLSSDTHTEIHPSTASICEDASFVLPLLPENRGRRGVLKITSYQIVFGLSTTAWQKEWICSVPVASIRRLVRLTPVRSKDCVFHSFAFSTKDYVQYQLLLENEEESRRIFHLLESLAFPPSLDHMFAFAYRKALQEQKNSEPQPRSHNYGWDVFHPMREFQRLNFHLDSPGSKFRLSLVNANYQLCESYPSLLVVPASVPDSDLVEAANFRAKKRIPAICWRHPENGAVLVRCGQPKEGLRSRRCRGDEAFFEALGEMSSVTCQIKIIDARPLMNAYANKVKGAGFENTHIYKHVWVEFVGIPNLHTHRDCLRNLRRTLRVPLYKIPAPIMQPRTLPAEAGGDWLVNLGLILAGANRIVDALQEGYTTVVHCTESHGRDGWDRTSQLVSLAQLMVDPYYRTIPGFQVLIEKEWLSFGHKFAERSGLMDKNWKNTEHSPIFLQWIDCCWQLLQQAPAVTGRRRFGTFLCNSEKSRREIEVQNRTVSVWHAINTDDYWVYRTEAITHLDPLRADTSNLQLWENLYKTYYSFVEGEGKVRISPNKFQ